VCVDKGCVYRFKEIAGDSGDSGDKAPPSTGKAQSGPANT